MQPALTIIVPVYNEEESLPVFFAAMDEFLAITPLPTEVLYVNDGSSDNSPQLLRDKCADDPCSRFLSLSENRGLSTAIKAGIDHSHTTLTGYIDADLQTRPEDFTAFLPYFAEYDMVNGIRAKRRDSIVKKISSKVGNGWRRFMINDGIRDTCCPLKILKTEYAIKIPFFHGMHRFIPALVQLEGGRVKQIQVSHYSRMAGVAKYHLFNRLVGPFFDTLAFRWMRNRHISYTVAEKSTTDKTL
ncbi:MAG: glycosyltransferase family 2 protein [Desulforhopalus sp.]|nr:glycosyltransferase family 2 protein [Desulforhopalus sp.]